MSAVKYTGTMAQLLTRHWSSVSLGNSSFLHTAAVLEAARKGTRARAEAKKKANKKEVVKEYIPRKKRLELEMSGGASPRRKEDHLKNPIDDVWIAKFYKWKVYSIREAIAMHRETHHETQLGLPNSLIYANFEMSFALKKKTRFMDNFSDTVLLPHLFDSQEQRSLLVLTRNEEELEYAKEAGVAFAVGNDVIKMAKNAEIDFGDYDCIISELDFLTDLVPIRGLFKRDFPNPRLGTAGFDLKPIIDRFMNGIQYSTNKDKYHKDYATLEVPFGRLNMTDDELEDNLSVLINNIEEKKDKNRKSDDLITLMMIRSPPSHEQFKVDPLQYIERPAVVQKAVSQ